MKKCRWCQREMAERMFRKQVKHGKLYFAGPCRFCEARLRKQRHLRAKA
jgi:hypothetical protein